MEFKKKKNREKKEYSHLKTFLHTTLRATSSSNGDTTIGLPRYSQARVRLWYPNLVEKGIDFYKGVDL